MVDNLSDSFRSYLYSLFIEILKYIYLLFPQTEFYFCKCEENDASL